jgi:Protein phosphatase 2C
MVQILVVYVVFLIVKPTAFRAISRGEQLLTPARFLQALNRHPSHATVFQVGIAEDKGTRRTMEDAHSFVVDFDNIRGQGYFGLFDGHAGKHAAEWCGQHFHEVSTSLCLHQRLRGISAPSFCTYGWWQILASSRLK